MPPTRAELLASFTGPELAALIEEGCIIGTTRDFSRELERQVRGFPELMADSIVSRNWINGAFLIVKVVEDRQREVVLKVLDAEDMGHFIGQLSADARSIRIRDRRFSLLSIGPLRSIPEGASPEAIREILRQVTTPASFLLRPEATGDCGEDGIVAVNLTRHFNFNPAVPLTVFRAKQRTTFRAAVSRLLGGNSTETDLKSKVTHFIGGPCEEQKVICCLIVSKGRYTVIQDDDCLLKGLAAAEVKAERQAALEALQGHTLRQKQSASTGCSSAAADGAAAALSLVLGASASKRRRLDASGNADVRPEDEASEVHGEEASQDVQHVGPVRLFVFWGYAGWSRCQLMGEIARGSWGLCQATDEDIVSRGPNEVYGAVYPRLIFAPKSEMTESYGGHENEEEDERRQLRRMAILHEILRRHPQRSARTTLVDDDEEAPGVEAAPALPMEPRHERYQPEGPMDIGESDDEEGEEEEDADIEDEDLFQHILDEESDNSGDSSTDAAEGESGAEESE